MKFTESSLELAIIELFQNEWSSHIDGSTLDKELSDVIVREDLELYLLTR